LHRVDEVRDRVRQGRFVLANAKSTPLGHLGNQPLVSLLVGSEFVDTSQDTRRAEFGNSCLQIETVGNHVAGWFAPANHLADFLVQIHHIHEAILAPSLDLCE